MYVKRDLRHGCGTCEEAWSAKYQLCQDMGWRLPRSSVLRGLPSVSFGLSRRQRALCQPWHSVFPVVVQLSQPMPVDTCSVALKLVGDSDFNIVAPVRKYRRAHVLAVDQECDPRRAIWCCSAVSDLEVVFAGNSTLWPVDIEIGTDVEAILPAGSGLGTVYSALARVSCRCILPARGITPDLARPW